MELHSPIYLLALIAMWLFAGRLRRVALRQAALLTASYLFYLTWAPLFLGLLLVSSLLNFWLGRLLLRRRAAKLAWMGVVLNLVLWLSAARLGEWGTAVFSASSGAALLLPVGVSFYTFQALSYLLDVYRGFKGRPSPVEFALYMAFWPTVLAGPICRLPEMLPQFRSQDLDTSLRFQAMGRIVTGLAMKVVIADSLAAGLRGHGGIDQGFQAYQSLSAPDVLALAFGYGLQLFFDFAGYSHIAIGSAQLFGIRLRENFDRPYAATSPSQFWNRWHMSLSLWIRDYLFFPMAAAGKTVSWRLLALLVSMTVFGLWHGMGATFLAWGLLHGLLLVVHRLAVTWCDPRSWMVSSPVPGWILTYVLVNLSWILFRSGTLSQALHLYSSLVTGWSRPLVLPQLVRLVFVVGLCHLLWLRLRTPLRRIVGADQPHTVGRLLSPSYFTALLILVLAWGSLGSPFVYVRF